MILFVPYLNPFVALDRKKISFLKPWQSAKSVNTIDPGALYDWGVRAVGFDFDQTLAPYGAETVSLFAADAVKKFKNVFGDRLCVISNARSGRVAEAAGRIDLAVVIETAEKPSARAFLSAERYFGMPAGQCAYVGDRYLTDTLGANLAGWKSILVDPLDPPSDPVAVRIVRIYENYLAKFIK